MVSGEDFPLNQSIEITLRYIQLLQVQFQSEVEIWPYSSEVYKLMTFYSLWGCYHYDSSHFQPQHPQVPPWLTEDGDLWEFLDESPKPATFPEVPGIRVLHLRDLLTAFFAFLHTQKCKKKLYEPLK